MAQSFLLRGPIVHPLRFRARKCTKEKTF